MAEQVLQGAVPAAQVRATAAQAAAVVLRLLLVERRCLLLAQVVVALPHTKSPVTAARADSLALLRVWLRLAETVLSVFKPAPWSMAVKGARRWGRAREACLHLQSCHPSMAFQEWVVSVETAALTRTLILAAAVVAASRVAVVGHRPLTRLSQAAAAVRDRVFL